MARVWKGWTASLLASSLLLACNESVHGGDTQTNWLKECEESAECGGLECVCGRCTRPCEASQCGGLGEDASCFPATHQAVQSVCSTGEATAMCLKGCENAGQCGSGQQCLDGACVPDAAPPGSAGDAAGFCQLWVDSFVAYMERCGCGSDAASRYREQAVAACTSQGVGWGAAVERGELRYDAAAAAALFARLEASDPLCVKEPFRNLRLDSLEVYSFAGTFRGTRALGERCSFPVGDKGGTSDCSEGVCAADGGGGGVCIALVGVGEACDASGDENLLASSPRLCHSTRPPDSDGEYELSFDSLSCVQGVCAQDLGDGLACRLGEVCSSGRCTGTAPSRTCQPQAAPGEACSRSDDCLAGACRYDLTPRVCGELLADGLPCGHDDDACASGHCSAGANGGICIPPASVAIGSACTEDTECVGEGVCRSGLCFADICGDYLD